MQDQRREEKQTIIINQQNQSNSMGLAGLILSILAWFSSCLPIAGSIIWLLGLIFSIIGLFKRPRGTAIAGLVISCIGLILLLFFFGALAFIGLTAATLEH